MIESTADTMEGPILTALIPLFQPNAGADRVGVLAQGLAVTLSVSAVLLSTNKPLVVAIPAMQSLVMVGETLVPRSGADSLDLVETSHLLLVERRRLRRENLSETCC
jgi:hypothetical protein